MIKANKIICAIDFNDLDNAVSFIDSIKHDIVYKIGMEFFYNFGLKGIEILQEKKPQMKIFLDLKLHDIPNTVSRALLPLLRNIKPFMITLHISGGKNMLNEAIYIVKSTANQFSFEKPLVLGVTILTSLDKSQLNEMGLVKSVNNYVLKYAKIAKSSGLDGIVCSPLEIKLIKKSFGNSLKIVTPGIRTKKSDNNDQARILSPKEAFKSGSDYIVMGRPLIHSKNPNKLINDIINS